MTALVTKTVQDFIASSTYDHLSMSVGIIVIVLTIVLLVEREVLRAGFPAGEQSPRLFLAVLIPLLLACAMIVGTRFAVDVLRITS